MIFLEFCFWAGASLVGVAALRPHVFAHGYQNVVKTSGLSTILEGGDFRILLLGWGLCRRSPTLGIRVPRARDLLVAVGALLALAALVLPPGLLTGFLRWNPAPPTLFQGAGLFGGLALGLAIASLAFGLMHWNNRSDVSEQLIYCALASVAGLAYGLSFRYGGLFASVMTHSAVNWIWQVCLRA